MHRTSFAALLALLLAGGRAAAAEPADPELEVLARSLLERERAAADLAVGGLARLTRYRLDLALDPAGRRLEGRQQIAIWPEVALSELFLRIPANAAFLRGAEGPAVSCGAVTAGGRTVSLEDREDGVYRLALDPPAQPGALLQLEVSLSARVPDLGGQALDAESQVMAQASQFFGGTRAREAPTDHGAFGSSRGVFHLAGFFPEIVRRNGEIFDLSPEPGLGEPRLGPLANYVVSLRAPADVLVSGTGTEVGNTADQGGQRRFTRVAAAVRGFALVVAQGYEEQLDSAGPVRLRVIAPKAHALQARKVLHTAARAVEHFAAKFGPYPWADLQIAEAAVTGGLEAFAFPGHLAISAMLMDPSASSLLRSAGPEAEGMVDSVLEMAVAHQVAHQWWGGLVGADAREKPALLEPLATWSAVFYVEKRRGAAVARDLLESQVRNAYRLYRMLGQPDRPVDRPLADYSGRAEIQGLLGGKGALFFDSLRRALGEKAFGKALQRHYRLHRFKELDTEGMLVAAAGVAPGKANAALKLYDRAMHQTAGDQDAGLAATLPGMGPAGSADPSMQLLMQHLQNLTGGAPVAPAVPATTPPPGKPPRKKRP